MDVRETAWEAAAITARRFSFRKPMAVAALAAPQRKAWRALTGSAITGQSQRI